MTQHRDFNTGDILPAGFLDALQEYLGVGVFNFRLEKATADPATAIKVVTGDGATPSTGNAQVSIAITGQWRYRRTALSAAAPGGLAVGTHDIYVTAGALNTAQEDAGTFDYSFGLELKASGATPSTAVYRKVGTFDWDGVKITGITQTIGIFTSAQGAAGGELAGTYPNPTIGALAAGRVLTWGGDTALSRVVAGRFGMPSLDLTGNLAVPTVTALPASGYHGQVVYLLTAAMVTAGVPPWPLRYRALESDGVSPNPRASKWEPVGAALWMVEVAAAGTASSTSYVAASTTGPRITVPLFGDYIVEHGSEVAHGSAASYQLSQSFAVGGVAAIDADRAVVTSVNSGEPFTIYRRVIKTSLSAGVLLDLRHRQHAAGATATHTNRWLAIRPIRVSA